ncbi:MAG: glycosyltransferase family 4 protein [Mariprofundaceae bacterium]
MAKMVMRVAYVSQFASVVGGGEHSLMELITHLPDSIQPVLVVPEAGELSRKAEAAGIAVHYLPMPKIGFRSIPALWQWRSWLKRESFEIVHANQSRAAFYAGCAGLGRKTKTVFHCRIAERDRRLDGILMRLSDAIVCNSRAVSERFEAFTGKLQVIYNGVSSQQESVDNSEPLPEGIRLLLFVGRLSAEKQPQLALKLFEQLAGKFDDLHLALVGGDDPYNPEFSKSIRESVSHSTFASRIHLPGAVDSVAAWYHQAELLILTSTHEGFGRVLVEAMAEGVVPIAFSVGGVPEVVEDGVQGLLVGPDDTAHMGRCVEQLLQDKPLRLQMAEKGKVRALRFSIQQHVDQVCGVYNKLLSGTDS